MNWALIIGLSWLVIAVVAALLIGRALRVADERECRQRRDGRRPGGTTDDGPVRPAASPPEAVSESSEGTAPAEPEPKRVPAAGEPGRTSGVERLRPRRAFRRRHPGVDNLFTHRDAGAA